MLGVPVCCLVILMVQFHCCSIKNEHLICKLVSFRTFAKHTSGRTPVVTRGDHYTSLQSDRLFFLCSGTMCLQTPYLFHWPFFVLFLIGDHIPLFIYFKGVVMFSCHKTSAIDLQEQIS